MTPVDFRHAQKRLTPSTRNYSDNVESVQPLPIWTDGEQCLSCWQMSWRERLSALVFGRVWLAVLSGNAQPPAFLSAARDYLKDV